jgi:two-component system phosphate regulon sensor histidine kinase PhoR
VAQLEKASSTIVLDFLRNGPKNLQSLAEGFQSQGSLAYCAIVSSDGRYLAHSSPRLVGRVHAEPEGKHVACGEATRIRYSDSDSQNLLEYRIPLRRGDEAIGTLLMAVPEPSIWQDLGLVAPLLPVAAAGPLLCLVLGATVLRRMVRPLAEIETELNRVAVALSPAEVELREVKARSPAALGWNRLVSRHETDPACTGLEERLREAVGQLRQRQADEILDSLPDGLAVTDSDGCITYANQVLAAIAGNGTDGRHLRGKTMHACLELKDQAESGGPLLDPTTKARPVVAEIRRSNNGVPHVFRVARHPLRAAAPGSNGGHVWCVRDISQQWLAEQARNQFLDAAAHELRTPLANLRAYAETLTLSEKLDVEKQKDFCNTINSEATRLGRLIDDLLSISSMEVGSLSVSREDTDTERLLREVVEKVKPQMSQKGLVFTTDFPEKWPTLHLDKDKLAAAMVNLLGNAAKYTPSEGRVTLRVRLTENEFVIEVEDTGAGISAEELPKVFDKFFRSSDPRIQKESGSGLGLSFVQEVVRMHGGNVNVESERGAGSKFTVTLPKK